MASERVKAGEIAALAGWSEGLAEIHGRVAHRFRRVEVRERARRSLTGLLARVERKNGWQLAEALGEADPHGVQRLLNEAVWDTEGVRDDLRASVVQHRGDAASGVLIVDETRFLKAGARSCGVARQYSGAAGTTANAQVGVFLAYASDRDAAFIDRALSLPQAWTRDRGRRAVAGIPKAPRFATTITLAKRTRARAFAATVLARRVVADAGYGRSHAFRRWLERRGRASVMMVPRTTAIHHQERRERAEQLGARLPEMAWQTLPTGARERTVGAQQWVCLALRGACAVGMCRWLLVHRRADDPGERAYHVAYGPAGTTVTAFVRVCGARGQIEEGFAQAKGETGLDHDAVRGWGAWHRFVTVCLLAHAYLVVLRRQARAADTGAQDDPTAPDLLPLTVPEVRRLVLALAEAAARRAFRFAWSRWRRAHQARAARHRDAAGRHPGVAPMRRLSRHLAALA